MSKRTPHTPVPSKKTGKISPESPVMSLNTNLSTEHAVTQAVQHALAGIIIADMDRRIHYVNPRVVQMWRYATRDEIVGRNIRELLDDSSTPTMEDSIRILGENGRWEGELVARRIDGSTFTVLLSQSPIRDEENLPVGIVVSFIELTGYNTAVKKPYHSEDHYRTVLDHVGDQIHVVDRELKIILINRELETWVKRMGFDSEEIVGKSIFEVFPFLSDTARREYREVFETGRTMITEGKYTIVDDRFITEIRKIPIFDDDRVIQVMTIIRDITPRRRFEEELVFSEEKYRLIADNSPMGIIIHVDGVVRYCGGKVAGLLGFDGPEDIVGTHVKEYIHPDDRDFTIERAKLRARGDDVVAGYECRLVKRDGTAFPSLLYGNRINYFGEDAVQAAFIDISERKRAEEEKERLLSQLSISEAQYRTLVESSNDAVIVIQNASLVFFNKKLQELLGYDRSDIINKPFTAFLHPDDAQLVTDNYNLRMSGEPAPSTYELRGFTKKGDTIHAEINVVYTEWKGKPASLVFLRDITDRKRMEETLRESERLHRQLVENANDIIFISDHKGRFELINPIAKRISGYTDQDLIGKPFLNLIPDSHKRRVKRFYQLQFIKKIHDTYLEFPVITKNDATIWIGQNVQSITKNDQIIGYQAIARDITARILAEEALRESEEKYRRIFETSSDAIYLSTIDGSFIDVNPAGEKMLGYTREELPNINIIETYYNPDDFSLFIEKMKEEGFAANYPVGLKKRDGTPLECLITANLITDKTGLVIGFQGIIRDITEKKFLESQLFHAQKMEAIGALAGGMAHNFNNILVGIMGYSEYLLAKKQSEDPDYKALKTINDATIKASDLTRRLLGIARGGDHKPISLNINDVIKRVLPLATGTFHKSIAIETILPPKLPTIEGDPGQLEQCLLNIFINARDAMPNGGVLSITTYNTVLDEDFVKSHLESRVGDYVVVHISDTGIGMPSEVREHVFEPFFTTKGHSDGFGLGLSSVYGIIKNHRGFVTVHSEEGKGTTFRLYFPSKTGSVPKKTTDDIRNRLSGDETILIIDDEEIVRDTWCEVLEELGYSVLCAESGEKGLNIFSTRRETIDVVILDYILPKMGGSEVFLKLRELQPDIRILMSSGYGGDERFSEFLGMERVGFVKKPARITELTEQIRFLMDS
ncbi:MAG: PAS domain S-box protein [Deltaproteobacteria bacterium]|nr:PAS domain S-box protein [Candidatus Zymogenaceae bacterium]